MSRIDDLIRQHCPNGVEFRAIGEISELVRGNGMPKTDFADAGVGCIHYGQIYTYYGTWTTETISFISPEKAAKLAKVDPGDLIVTNTSENVEDVCKSVAWLGEEQIVTGGHATVLKHDQDPKYLAYYLQTAQFHADKKRHATGTKVIDVSAKRLAKIRIPVPPLEVQAEIVRVLDLFQSLEAELEAELEARRRQYAHYRSHLLVPDPVTTGEVPLAEIATFRYGHTASAAEDGDYRFIRITDITEMGTLDPVGAKFVEAGPGTAEYLVRSGDLLMARTGATFGKTLHIAEDMDAVYASFLIRIRVDPDRLLPRYYWHFAQSERYWRQARALASHGGQPQFNGNALGAVLVPVPSIDEQNRIVAILDNFDALVNDLSVGLPAELAARRRQYEHYRNRLLSFEEAA